MSTSVGRDADGAAGGDPGVVQLSPEGDLDARSVHELHSRLDTVLRDPAVSTVVIDLRLVRFVDSSGLGALIAARTHADVTGTRLVLSNPATQLRDLVALTGAEGVFTWA